MLALAALSSSAQELPRNTILDLARAWTGDSTALRCDRVAAGASDIADQTDPRLCRWERSTPERAFERIQAGIDLAGGPSLRFWERSARDSADAARLIDSLDVVNFPFAPDAVLAVVHYRTYTPSKDSVAVRKTLISWAPVERIRDRDPL